MVRFTFAVLILISLASAQTRPAAGPRDLTPDEQKELHREAIELMKSGDVVKAAEKLERVYLSIPQASQGRGLVINHAIVDMAQKKFVMRAVRDLTAYLKRNRAQDELMMNVLGVALNQSADDPKIKAAPVWQAGLKEWDRRNYLLDHSRPGFRRWGTRWITDEEYARIDGDRERFRRAVADQIERVNRAVWRVGTLNEQSYTASMDQWRHNYLRNYMSRVKYDPTLSVAERVTAARKEGDLEQGELEAWMTSSEISGELRFAIEEMNKEQAVLRGLKRDQLAIRPSWPRSWDPVDPDIGPPPPTTAPANALATPTTAPAPGEGAKPTPTPVPAKVSPDDLYGPSTPGAKP